MKTDEGSGKAPGASGEPPEDEHTKLTRNLNELLQELRVMQTGVQILTGFLLTVPFTTRFADLDQGQKWVYLAVLCGSVVTTALIVAPVAFHRTLFRQGERAWIVESTNRAAQAGLAVFALTMSGVVWLVFDLVIGRPTSHVTGALFFLLFALLWGALPVVSRRRFNT